MSEDQKRTEEEIPEIEAGKAAADAYRQWRNTTEVQNLSVLVATVADAVLRRVRPVVVGRALREVDRQIWERAEELRRDMRSGSYGVEYVNGMEDASMIVERAIARAELPVVLSGGTPEPTDG